MKIFHLITGLNVGGAEAMLSRLLASACHRDAPENFSVVALSGEGAIAQKIRALGIKVICLGLNPSLPSPVRLHRLLALVREDQPDVIQSWMYHADLIGGWVGARLGIPVIWGVRRTSFPRLPFFGQTSVDSKLRTALIGTLCAHLSYRWPSRVVCCAESARYSHVQGGYDPERMIVIHNGVDIERFRSGKDLRREGRRALGLSPDEFAVGMVGRDDPLKDHSNFVATAVRLASISPRIRFVLVGRGVDNPDGHVRGAIEDSGIADRFMVLGEREDVPEVMNALDLFCLSSKSEGFPNVLAEAMACGVPVVTTNVGDASLIVGECGIVVPPQRPELLAEAAASVFNLSDEERRALGERGRGRIGNNFSMASAWSNYQALYRGVVATYRQR